MHEAEHEMMEAITDVGGSAAMVNLKGQLQVAREEMVRSSVRVRVRVSG